MTENAKRAIIWLVLAAGIILGILGWATDIYESMQVLLFFFALPLFTLHLEYYGHLKRINQIGFNILRNALLK